MTQLSGGVGVPGCHLGRSESCICCSTLLFLGCDCLSVCFWTAGAVVTLDFTPDFDLQKYQDRVVRAWLSLVRPRGAGCLGPHRLGGFSSQIRPLRRANLPWGLVRLRSHPMGCYTELRPQLQAGWRGFPSGKAAAGMAALCWGSRADLVVVLTGTSIRAVCGWDLFLPTALTGFM